MKIFKRCFIYFLALTTLAVSAIMPVAHSYVYDWDIRKDNVYFEYDFGVDIKVNETIDGNIKKDVKIQNSGKSSVYAKAMVVFTPISKDDGSVLTNKIVNSSDITLEWNSDAINNGSWIAVAGTVADRNKAASEVQDNNFYPYVFFWNKALSPDDITDNLINSVKVNTTEYNVRVDIITDGIYEGDIQTWCDIYGLDCNKTTRTLSKA